MKRFFVILLCLALLSSLFGCKNDEVTLTADDVHGVITYYYEANGDDGNYVKSFVDNENNAVVVEMKDISEEKQDEFIHTVFSHSTGSAYIKYLKEHSMLEFVMPNTDADNIEKYDLPYKYNVAYANWTEDGSIYLKSLNNGLMTISSVCHIPVYKFDSTAELDLFKSTFDSILSMDGSYDEVPSLNSITSSYDDAFFSENSLMLVYVTASSGSFRYGVTNVGRYDSTMCIFVDRLNDPECFTDDMAGWFVLVEVDRDDIDGVTAFDAQLLN